MADSDADKAAQLIASPIGGFAIAAFLYPMGCTEIVRLGSSCPPGQATNFLGSTVFGNVGRFSDAELVLVGLFVAVIVYLGVDLWKGRQRKMS